MNSRFQYVPFSKLDPLDQEKVKKKYTDCEWIPFFEYEYPIKKNGKLAKASRTVSLEKARELYQEYVVEKVMES